ncbi:hypothetical protein [Acaryochloris marina]|uniref:hypothetical protein n=1 Tax=Acaryochloris marina TaxID=155978 RepID=UPI001BB0933F|nr:hypothetical protein [Acaryochloris marina]QUY43157.1 hypothetical protein I1H34_03090 [Acaryochloris marina S15]
MGSLESCTTDRLLGSGMAIECGDLTCTELNHKPSSHDLDQWPTLRSRQQL